MPATLRQRPTPATNTSSASNATIQVIPPTPSSHSHSPSHSHGDDEASALLAAIQGSTERGSRITLIGLASNVGLTGVKGVAGYTLGSAALLADAAHSGSDLVADVVTLATFRTARKPISLAFPYGYGKFESMGSLLVAGLLFGTSLGIGLHSYHSLIATLPSLDPAYLSMLPASWTEGAAPLSDDETSLHAIWFAGASVLIKEYLYRITLRVADEENSNVLRANAFHHRSDAFSSLVVLGAIAGAWFGAPILDPVGGLFVAALIMQSAGEVAIGAFHELTDKTADPTLAPQVYSLVASLRNPKLPPLAPFSPADPLELLSADSDLLDNHAPLDIVSIPSIRVFTSGPSIFIDMVLELPVSSNLATVNMMQETIKRACEEKFGGPGRVREVRIVVKGV